MHHPHLSLTWTGSEKACQRCASRHLSLQHPVSGWSPHLDVKLLVMQGSLQLQQAPLEGSQLYGQLLSLVLRVSLALQQQVFIVGWELRQGHHLLLYFHQHVLGQQRWGWNSHTLPASAETASPRDTEHFARLSSEEYAFTFSVLDFLQPWRVVGRFF